MATGYNSVLRRAIQRAFRRYGVNPALGVATTLVESGGRLGAIGDAGRSHGPFQEYDLGRGSGLSVGQRRDPWGSAERAAREFAHFARKGYRGGALAAAAQRPADRAGYERKVNAAMAQALKILGGSAGELAPASAELPGGGGVPESGGVGVLREALALRRPDESLTSAVRRGLVSQRLGGAQPLTTGGEPSSPAGDLVTGIASGAARGAIEAAQAVQGTPYSWGGGGPGGPSYGFGRGKGIKGFDCSSLIQYAYSKIGVKVPRTTYGQIKAGRAVRDISQVRPGDLLFPSTGHVQMYIGNGRVIESPRTGEVVRVAPLRSRYQTIRRIVQ